MTRIVAGAARGRRLRVPSGRSTRPTSDRAREGLFSTLESLLGALAGRRAADLYAGSGAVGLEALSRGAAHVLLVESEPRAVRTLRANIESLGLDGAEIRADRVDRMVAVPSAVPAYDVVFLDPPYDLPGDALRGVLVALHRNGWVAPGSLVAVERSSHDPPWEWPRGYAGQRSRRYGEATLWYGRAALLSEPVESEE